jgi:hypothetical protein
MALVPPSPPRPSGRFSPTFVVLPLFFLATLLGGGVLACQGCRKAGSGGDANGGGLATADVGAPTVRLYIVSDVAGALEPCGCVKDQLGGMDHLAAFIAKEKAKAPSAALISAGPLFFLDPTLKEEKRAQDVEKAKTIARSLASLNLAAFAPGKNDFAAGVEDLEQFRTLSGGALVAGNLSGQAIRPAWREPVVREINGVKLGFVGVSAPERDEGGAPPGVTAEEPIAAVKRDVASLKQRGVKVVVALAAVGRGEAKRIADNVPELTAVVVGSPGGAGDANTETPPPERIGNVIVAETGNHLTKVAVLDLHVRNGELAKFSDGSGLEQSKKRADLDRRVDELRGRIAQWEGDKQIPRADVDARKADLAKLQKEREALTVNTAPAEGSFFRYRIEEVRDTLGKEPAVTEQMLQYYKQVNERNKTAFADRKPRPAAAGEASFVGVESCSTCHDDARRVWDKTAHAHAYATLSKEFKEYNLDCVSCHVTGYDLPGGSTVTHVSELTNVQCEVCHGPGSKHAAKPTKVKMPIEKPKPDSCLACHHPPHVHEFDAPRKMAEILGPGHGKPAE